MKISKRPFGVLSDGTKVSCWTLTSESGHSAEILDYGVTIRSITVPDKNGNPVDVVLGYDTLEEYVSSDGYLGATVGRVCNRIKDASFALDGQTYQLFANDGSNHLHGGKQGFDRYVWDSRQEGDTVVFSRVSAHGEENYPGNLQVQVTAGWSENTFTLRYLAQTDRNTPVSLTNNSYFNLNGAGNGNINQHMLKLNADRYTPNGPDFISTGHILPVDGSAMDFRVPKAIGQDAGNDEPCVKYFHGYDSNFVVSGHPVATVVGDKSGITMTVDSDLPGVQLYTANMLGDRKGKNGTSYGFRSGFCLETQYFPDSVHNPQWPSCILHPGETYQSFTSYTFL